VGDDHADIRSLVLVHCLDAGVFSDGYHCHSDIVS
jgi:hypothetical protein